MTLHRTTVQSDLQIDLNDPASCLSRGLKVVEYPCACALRIIDRVMTPETRELEPDQYVGIRSYRFKTPLDRFSIYITFANLKAVPDSAYPTLKWRIQLGVGQENERTVEGTYTPDGPNEVGLLVSFCSGMLFSTMDLCFNIDDPSGQDRSMTFQLGAHLMLATTCFPIANCGENGTITWIRPPTQPTPVILAT